jgi:hypothetical protein
MLEDYAACVAFLVPELALSEAQEHLATPVEKHWRGNFDFNI